MIPDQLGTYEYVVTMVDSTPMTNNGQPQPDICHDTVRFVGLANFDHNILNVSCYNGNDGVITLDRT